MRDYKWPNQEAQDNILMIWKQIQKKVCREILERIKKQNDLPYVQEADSFEFEPDMFDQYEWEVKTRAIRVFNSQGDYIASEKIFSLRGRLFIQLGLSVLHPSFKFFIEDEKKAVTIEMTAIYKSLEDYKWRMDNACIELLPPEIFNKEIALDGKFGLKTQDEKNLREAFKYFGYSKDEVSLLVHNVVTSELFEEGMPLGDMVTIGLNKIKEEE